MKVKSIQSQRSVAASWMVIVLSDDALATLLIEAASVRLAEHVVGNRPGRVEPRDQARAKLIGEKSP